MQIVSLSSLDDSLWKVFSLSHRLQEADHTGMVRCYTCGKIIHYQKSDLGHYISRALMSTKYDEDNVRIQCWECNRFKGGQTVNFREELVDEIGVRKVKALEKRRHKPFSPDELWFRNMIAKHKEIVKRLKNDIIKM